ncbi:MAG: 4Fe-4S dicluster domain-containing protein [Cytophagales bacterium]|nr:4Fe-4S dicluster domain-containing protein [Cytophagales bacterium]
MGYFRYIWSGITTTVGGLALSFRHIRQSRSRRTGVDVTKTDYFAQPTGTVTLQYPFETLPIPDHGRYRLDLEMDDCIVCDKCAKVCPVDCIEIETIKSTEQYGTTSDGTSKRLYAAKFDIDMAKCCYCGLCTTVCPTECLTMTKTFDYSETDVKHMNYHFSVLSPQEAEEKRKAYELAQAAKVKPAPAQPSSENSGEAASAAPKPFAKPIVKKYPNSSSDAGN